MLDLFWLAPPLAGWQLALALAVVFVAAVVRGFSGFGFSAITLAGLTLLVSPAKVIPAVFVLEVVSSLGLFVQQRKDINTLWLKWITAGNVLGIPLGVAALTCLPEAPLALGVSAVLLSLALLLRWGPAARLPDTDGAKFLTGLLSGVVNGFAAVGGLVIALLMGTSRLPPAQWRATMTAVLLVMDLYALACVAFYAALGQSTQPLLSGTTLVWAVWMTPPLVLGIALGHRVFMGVSVEVFRARVLDVLMAVCALALLGRLASLV